ncbi:MAG: T9SS type A sorting domain-containing protein [Flavobacteriales bacterium]
MRKILLSVIIFSTSYIGFAQANPAAPTEKVYTNKEGQAIHVAMPTSFIMTPPALYWEDAPEVDDKDRVARPKKSHRLNEVVNPNAEPQGEDPVLQKEYTRSPGRAPIVNFQGLNSSGLPPDPTGAVGPNHYVQAVNTAFRVYNKAGVGQGAAKSLSSLWTGSTNAGDPIVMYDRHADRWFISQFQFNNRILIAISQTSDPNGSYYAYSYQFPHFPDYPKFSIWWDGYYMSSNSGSTTVAFDRAKMLVGDPTAAMVRISTAIANNGFRCMLPADADGPLPPAGTPCYFFNLEDDAWASVPTDRIRVYTMTCDWTTPANSSVSLHQTIPAPAFNSNFTGGFANIAQPGTTQRLDAIQNVFMYRAQHMRWVGYNTIVLTHANNMGSNRSGIRWYELRDANDGNWAIFQSGTYAPDATGSRFMSSAAMDIYGNIGMGYSHVDATNNISAGLRYTGRYKNDPTGQMTVAETIAQAGSGAQTNTDRYGDYAQMSLDIDGVTFWYTGEYLQSGAARTRVFSFQLHQSGVGLVEQDPFHANLSLKAVQQGSIVYVEANGLYNDDALVVDIISMDGKAVVSRQVIPSNNQFTQPLNVNDIAAGTYFVRIGNADFQKVEKLFIQKF